MMILNSKEVKEIHRLLRNSIIHPEAVRKWFEGSKEDLARELSPLDNYFVHHYPSSLFKLKPVSEKALEALQKDELYLTRADHFNDPYDCFLSFDAEGLKNAIENHLSDVNMISTLEANGVHFPTDSANLSIESFFDLFHSKKNEFLQSCSNILPVITKELQENTYISSLTENIDSPVMWAHYADYHKGFAIEYQFRADMFPPQPMIVPNDNYNWYGWRSILPVYYSSERMDGTDMADWLALCKWLESLFGGEHKEIDMSVFLPDMLLKTKLCLQKASEWAYEREWRLMVTHNWPNQIGADSINIIYPPSAIYLGDRITDQDSNKLKEIAIKKGIPIYQMYIDQAGKDYKLEMRKI